MNYPPALVRGVLLCFGLALAGNPVSFARQSGLPIPFQVTSVVNEDVDRELIRASTAALREALIARGGEISDQPWWVLLVGATEIDSPEEGKVALSVVALQPLPEQAVSWAKSSEIFYATLSDEQRANLPPEGKHIREYMSEDFIRHFRSVQDQIMSVVDRSAIRAGMDEIVDSFYRHNVRVQ